jgi:ribose transport system substrate-binding protein
MKKSKKAFVIIELALAVMAVVLTVGMLCENYGEQNHKKVSVIIQNSNDNQWAAFKYGLKMAAADLGLEVYTASVGELESAKELQNVIEEEVQNGADAVIVQPIAGEETGKMLQKIQGRIPVILIESAASNDKEDTGLAVVEPDQYAMGKQLAEELLSDYGGKLDGKKIGIVSQAQDTQAVIDREQGFREALRDSGAEIVWAVSGVDSENGKDLLGSQTRVDIIAALDDNSLVAAGSSAGSYKLRGAVVYGIGHSTDAFYYLDTGIVECLVMPDEFQRGYRSMAEIAERLGHYFYKMKAVTVDQIAIRREDMFSEENQEIIFMMSQ